MDDVTTRRTEDYVIATGRTETIRKFVEICAIKLNWNSEKNGPGILGKVKV